MQGLHYPLNTTQNTLLDGSIVYQADSFPKHITSFELAKSPLSWRDHYQSFAYVIVNQQLNEMILVRDHLGLAPFYYCHGSENNFTFGQTIPDVLQQLPNTPPLLENQIAMLFSAHKTYSDETFYRGIYRVEPGHLMHFKSDGSVVKKAFWQLDPHEPLLHYKDERDYLAHFSMLMDEAILHSTENKANIAAEFSAGLDSSSVYCAATKNHITPKLYMHVASSNTESSNQYNNYYEKAFIAHFQLQDIQRIDAEHFDPIEILKQYASWFAGPAPYLFPMFANPVHQAVKKGLHPILLSGFGGDQCVSGQVPLNFFIPEMIHQGEYQKAWCELAAGSSIKRALRYAKYMHPALYAQALNLKIMKQRIANILNVKNTHKSAVLHPYEYIYCSSAREAEYSLLQGHHCHEVRMRIEYSSIIAKKMGFEYRYPLLYPKLLEFMLRVPTIQKRLDGRGRYLIRQYLSQFFPEDLFGTYKKKEGLGIVPGTFDLYQEKYKAGCYQDIFKNLPYAHLIQSKHQSIELRNAIKGFMIQAFHATQLLCDPVNHEYRRGESGLLTVSE